MGAERDAEFLKRFSAALERKGGTNSACPVCGQTQWIVDPRQVVLLKATDHSGDPATVQHDPAIANVCGHCGLVRLHVRSVLLDERESSIAPTVAEKPPGG